MGDRGNIKVVMDVGEPIYLYGHWSGSVLPDAAKRALIQAAGSGRYANDNRWGEGPYLARCAFQALVGDDHDNTSFGISTGVLDNEYPIIVLDSTDQTVRLLDFEWQSRAETERTQHWTMKELAEADDPGKLLGWDGDDEE